MLLALIKKMLQFEARERIKSEDARRDAFVRRSTARGRDSPSPICEHGGGGGERGGGEDEEGGGCRDGEDGVNQDDEKDNYSMQSCV